MKTAIAVSIGLLASHAAHAQLLVAKGTKATLTVSYEYSAIGKKADKYDPAEWRVLRKLNMVVPMTAEPEQALSQVRPIEAGQMASIEKKQAQVAGIQKKMQPTMDEMMKVAEECGDNEACIEKAIIAYSQTVDPTQVQSLKGDVSEAMKQDGPRYQSWLPRSETGTFLIDEEYRSKVFDPGCHDKPNSQCSREETRKGSGELPRPPGSQGAYTTRLDVDTLRKDIYIVLPVPLVGLGYTKQVTSNMADEKSGSSAASASLPGKLPPVTAVIPGALRNVSGTQTIKMNGAAGEGGTLTIKRQIALQ